MNSFKAQMLAAAAAVTMGVSAQAATSITFDPSGTPGAAGNISNVGVFDYLPGSALAVGVNSSTGILPNTAFTTYFQAQLGSALDINGNPVFTNGQGGYYFTAVAGFGEKTSATSTPTSVTFNFDATNPVNFFKIFAVPTFATNLTGAGFTSATPILTGTVLGTGFVSNFSLTNPQPTPASLLDVSSNGNQWGTTQSVSGAGSSAITVRIDSFNSNYFPDLPVGSLLSFSTFTTQQVLAFSAVDPSQFLSNGTTSASIASNVGSINGAPIALGGGPDVLFQTDANANFVTAAIPEPATLSLVGLALVGLGLSRRRTSKAQSA